MTLPGCAFRASLRCFFSKTTRICSSSRRRDSRTSHRTPGGPAGHESVAVGSVVAGGAGAVAAASLVLAGASAKSRRFIHRPSRNRGGQPRNADFPLSRKELSKHAPRGCPPRGPQRVHRGTQLAPYFQGGPIFPWAGATFACSFR